MLEKILENGFAEMSINAGSESIARFRKYYDMLDERNRVMNLTAITGEEDSARLHFLDSVSPLLALPFAGKSVIDVGTGAGFPGLPLKIAEPSIRLTLLDSLNKRVAFLSEVCESTGLQDVECVHGRAEECGKRREKYDYAVSRAVARLNVLCELCLPYVKTGGAFLALKGPAVTEELDEAKKAIGLLGGRLDRVFEYSVPGTDLRHNIVIIKKISATPAKYPRQFSAIKKAPL